MLEHLHNPAGIPARATGLLSANGSIIVSIPNIAHNSILTLWKTGSNTAASDCWTKPTRFFSKASLTKLVHQAGLQVHHERNARNVVENTEFKHSLADLPPEVARAMAKRDYADVYQFVWELKKARWAQPYESHRPRAGASDFFFAKNQRAFAHHNYGPLSGISH